MTDRELLELAAKAIGVTEFEWFGPVMRFAGHGGWNPLESDGDALRLAVKRSVFHERMPAFLAFFAEEIAMDRKPSEATRRAIVRAVL